MLKLGPKSPIKSDIVWDEYGHTNVVQILVSHHQDSIKSIQFVYADKGCLRHSQTYGEPSHLNFNIVTFKYPSEYLTSVSGAHTVKQINNNPSIVGLSSITFGTNKGKYGPFGMVAPSTNKFNYDFGHRSCFLGFHGIVRNKPNERPQVMAIGIYVRPITSLDELEDEELRSKKRIATSYYI